MDAELTRLLVGRDGHFQMESGYHAATWYELDAWFKEPKPLRPFVAELAAGLAEYKIDAICGPRVGGAKLACEISQLLKIEVFVSERQESSNDRGLFPVLYRLNDEQRSRVKGKRVAIVDDAISAGSAVRGTLADLRDCDADVVVIGSLLVFGDLAERWARTENLEIVTLAKRPFDLWTPADCPLCQRGLAFEKVSDVAPPRS